MKKHKLLTMVSLILAVSILFVGCSNKKVDDPVDTDVVDKEEAVEINWPERTVEIILPYNAGGDTDLYARAAAKHLGKILGKTFVIVNTPGGSGIVAAKQVMASKPDGYTMLFNHSASLVQETTGLADFSYSDDFENAGTIASDSTYTMVCRADSGWNSLQDVIDEAKKNPDEVTYSLVFGSVTHYVATQFEESAGIKMNKIDVGSSSADRTAAFLGGQVDLLVANYVNLQDYIENGDVIPLGILSEERLPTIPDVPTFLEQGVEATSTKEYEFKFPKGTDPEIVSKFTNALKEVAENEDFKEELKRFHAQAKYRSPEDTTREDKAEVERIREIMKAEFSK